MVCRDFILSLACESCLFLFAQLIVPYPYLNDCTDLRNKRDIPLLGAFPELTDIYKQAHRRCILDGELIITSTDGSPDFEAMQARTMLTDPARIRLASTRSPASFVAFDILYCDGIPLMERPLMERKQILNGTITESSRLAISRVFDNMLHHNIR